MRRIVLPALIATCVPLAGTPAAHATPRAPLARKVCQLLVDASGDVQVAGAVGEDTATTDLLSADLATGARTLVAVVRVRSLAPEPNATLGFQYTVTFTVDEAPWWLRFQRSVGQDDRAQYGQGTPGNPAGKATGHVDTQTSSVFLTLPRSTVSGLRGARLGNLKVRTDRLLGAVYNQADIGASTAVYVDRTPSCVAPA